jgi:hypothetical protein
MVTLAFIAFDSDVTNKSVAFQLVFCDIAGAGFRGVQLHKGRLLLIKG